MNAKFCRYVNHPVRWCWGLRNTIRWFDTIAINTALGNHPADLRWDGTGTGVRFKANYCATSIPAGLCR